MKETKILNPLPELTDSATDGAKERRKICKALGHDIKTYLADNSESLTNMNSTLSFDDFLMLFEIDYDQYLLAIRSTLFCTKVMLKQNLNEITINNYNPMIRHMHQANMDIEFILDPYACCMYIVDYINKSNKEITKILETETDLNL
ncbi:hypothetical protein INT47_006014 [Mucor saturninus]|uniref:Uncharacterized protein n=1 Tax=Mucor saturninus TaxID=64648 RepID=A0A8H7QFN8_9FUNG|nr:hypothetical protein INT47_006014 [Mucor saturninus]